MRARLYGSHRRRSCCSGIDGNLSRDQFADPTRRVASASVGGISGGISSGRGQHAGLTGSSTAG
jgi:hypothetical protein